MGAEAGPPAAAGTPSRGVGVALGGSPVGAGARSRRGAIGVAVAVSLAVLAQGRLLADGGVSEYHSEVALVATDDAGAFARSQCPSCEERTVVGAPGHRIVELTGSGKLLWEWGDRRHWLGYVPFMVVNVPATLDLWATAWALRWPGVTGLKAFTLANFALCAGLMAVFAWRWLGAAPAALAVLLLGFDPFVAMVLRVAPMPLRLPAWMFACLIALHAARTRPRVLGLAGLLLGLGLVQSLMFAWCGMGVVAWAWLEGDLRRWGRRDWGRLLVGGAIGFSPWVVYNVATRWATFTWMARNGRVTEVGAPSLSWSNVMSRVEQASALLDPAPLMAGYAGWTLPSGFAGPSLLLAAAWAARRRPGWALLAMPPAILAASPLTLASIGPHHMAIALPSLLLLVAWASVDAMRGRKTRVVAGAALLAWWGSALRIDAAWIESNARTGGVRMWSDSGAALAVGLRAMAPRPVAAVQPQPMYAARYLGGVEVWNPYGWDVNTGPPVDDTLWARWFADPDALYVRRVLPDGPLPRAAAGQDAHWAAFQAAVERHGARLLPVARYPEGDPELGWEVWAVGR